MRQDPQMLRSFARVDANLAQTMRWRGTNVGSVYVGWSWRGDGRRAVRPHYQWRVVRELANDGTGSISQGVQSLYLFSFFLFAAGSIADVDVRPARSCPQAVAIRFLLGLDNMSLLQQCRLPTALAATCLLLVCAVSSADEQDHEPADDMTDAEIDAAHAQLQAMWNTIKMVVGTVLALILGFYGWTFWTSIKCYFASKATKELVAAQEKKAAADKQQQEQKDKAAAAKAEDAAPKDTSIPPIDRQLRPIGPYKLKGEVVKGFGRGSSELGWPTANLDPAAFKGKIDDSEEGVYIAWAQVVRGGEGSGAPPPPVFKSLVSVGWNPAYDNTEKTVEAYVCEKFSENFYGAELRLLIVGYLRPQVRACAAVLYRRGLPRVSCCF